MALNGSEEIYGFPDDAVSPEQKKSTDFGLRYFRAMYQDYERSNYIYSNQRGRYIINRKYAEGMQSVQKYKDLLGVEGDTGYLNLDFSPITIVPKFVDVLVGGMINQNYKIQCNAIDPTSLSTKEKEKNKIYANMMLADFNREMKETTGISMIPEGEFVPESNEEAELYMQLNYKQSVEISMEEAIELVLSNNDWKGVQEQILRDLIVLKKSGIRIYYDKNNDIRLRYIDPVRLITTYTDKPDFKNIHHAGEIIKMTIHELKEIAQDQFSEKEYKDIAKIFARRSGSGQGYRYYYSGIGTGRATEYDDIHIEVMDAEFFSIHTLNYEEKEKKHGGFYFEKRPFGYMSKDQTKNKRELYKKQIKVKYKGYWITGTDYVFNYGLATNMTRQKRKGVYSPETNLSFIIIQPNLYDMENKSLVERMIPFADQMQLTHLKLQQLIAKARPKGLAIDVQGLEGVMKGQGGQFLGPLELQSIYDQTGVYYYRGISDDGSQKATRTIDEIENGIGRDVERLINIYNYNLQLIRDVTGVNEIRDASAPSKDALVGVQKLALQASNNATRTLNQSYLSLMERMAKEMSLMIQDVVSNGKKVEGYYNAIGEQSIKTLSIGKELSLAEFGIKIEVLPDEEERALVEQNIQQALARDGIRLEDAISIRQVARLNVKLANQMLILRRKKYQEEKLRESQANSQFNAQQQQQSAITAAEQERMTEETKLRAEMLKLQEEYRLRDEFEEKQHQRRTREITLEQEYRNQQIELASEERLKEKSLPKESREPRIFRKSSVSV